MAGSGPVNALALERSKLIFKPSDLTTILYGAAKAKRLIQDWNRLAQDDVLKNSPELYAMSRPELLEEMYKKSARLTQTFDLYKDENEKNVVDAGYHFQFTMPLATHWAMFRKAIEVLGTARQREKWIKLIRENKIFGAYAQTELGHGSDVRNLETVATFDKAQQEFIINTPRISATKFWVGTLGLTATHCVLFAQLISDGVNHGVHPFIVQIRSQQTHMPVKGVTVGELGPKLGYHGMDNGYLQLHNVRVPLDNMLARFGRVRKDGTYFSPPFASMRYFVMMNTRVTLIHEAARYLAKAATIAVRYSLVREGPGRVLLLDYQLQQFRLFGVLANTYAMFTTSLVIDKMHVEMVARIREGDLSYVKSMHALTSGIKALFSSLTLSSIEVCRQCCGGHGYSEYSGLPAIYMNYAPTVTYEGDNTVLLLQCGSFLFKQLQKAKDGRKLTGWMEYLNYTNDYVKHRCVSKSTSDFLNVLIYEEALRVRSAFLCKRLYDRVTHDLNEVRTT